MLFQLLHEHLDIMSTFECLMGPNTQQAARGFEQFAGVLVAGGGLNF